MSVVEVPGADGATYRLYSNSYALVIGNGVYMKGYEKIPQAENDAHIVAAALERNGFTVIKAVNTTRREFDRIYYDFLARYGNDPYNRVLIYFAGHGETIRLANGIEHGSIVMVDAPRPHLDPAGFYLGSVSMKRLSEDALRMRAHHVLFMFDSCFSGTLFAFRSTPEPPPAIADHIVNPVRQFITAGSADQLVPDDSVFRKTFVDLLEGRHPDYNGDGYLTGRELAYILGTVVPAQTRGTRYYHHPQHAILQHPDFNKGDFVFTLTPP